VKQESIGACLRMQAMEQENRLRYIDRESNKINKEVDY